MKPTEDFRIEDIPSYELEKQDDLDYLNVCLKALEERERIIVLARFSDNPKTFKELSESEGRTFPRTVERMRQIYLNAMHFLEIRMDSDSRKSSDSYFEFERMNKFKRYKKGKKTMDWFKFKNKKNIKGKMDEDMILYLYKQSYR